MSRKKSLQPVIDLPIVGEVFNLAGQRGEDPVRVWRERLQTERIINEAREYQNKMQRILAECPGFAGCDAPTSDLSQGRVVIEPARVTEAMQWLKRRFHVSENLELSPDNGLAIDIKPRVRSCKTGARRRSVGFVKVEQFELAL